MSSPEIVPPISSPLSENKTSCDFYVEPIESCPNLDQLGSGYGSGIKKSLKAGSSLGVGRYELFSLDLGSDLAS